MGPGLPEPPDQRPESIPSSDDGRSDQPRGFSPASSAADARANAAAAGPGPQTKGKTSAPRALATSTHVVKENTSTTIATRHPGTALRIASGPHSQRTSNSL